MVIKNLLRKSLVGLAIVMALPTYSSAYALRSNSTNNSNIRNNAVNSFVNSGIERILQDEDKETEERGESKGNIGEIIETLDKEGIYLALWCDSHENGFLEIEKDVFLQNNFYFPEDTMLLMYIIPNNSKRHLLLKDLFDERILREEKGDEFEYNGSKIRVSIIPVAEIYPNQKFDNTRPYRFELIDGDGKSGNKPVSTREFYIDYRGREK